MVFGSCGFILGLAVSGLKRSIHQQQMGILQPPLGSWPSNANEHFPSSPFTLFYLSDVLAQTALKLWQEPERPEITDRSDKCSQEQFSFFPCFTLYCFLSAERSDDFTHCLISLKKIRSLMERGACFLKLLKGYELLYKKYLTNSTKWYSGAFAILMLTARHHSMKWKPNNVKISFVSFFIPLFAEEWLYCIRWKVYQPEHPVWRYPVKGNVPILLEYLFQAPSTWSTRRGLWVFLDLLLPVIYTNVIWTCSTPDSYKKPVTCFMKNCHLSFDYSICIFFLWLKFLCCKRQKTPCSNSPSTHSSIV